MTDESENSSKRDKSPAQLIGELQELLTNSKEQEAKFIAANQQLEASNQQLIATEQQLRAANQQLAASEEKYRMLFQKMLDGFAFHQIVTDGEGRAIDYIFIEVNKAFENMTGLKRGKIIGKRVTEVLPGMEHDPADWIGQYGEVALSGKELRFEQFSAVLDRWFSVYAYCPDKGYFVTVFRDITERKDAENELRILSTAVEQSPVTIAITDTNGIIRYVNPKFTEITGYSYDEAVGQNPRILKSGEQSPEFYKGLWDTIIQGQDWKGEFHNKKKNGELYWESALISPIRNENGEMTNYIAIKEDITELKKIERIQSIIQNILNAVITGISLDEFLMIVKTELDSIIDTGNLFIALYNQANDTFELIFHKDKYDQFTTFPAGKSLTAYVVKTKKALLATKEWIDLLISSGEVEVIGTSAKVWLGVPMFIKGEISGVIVVQSYENESAYNLSDLRTLEIISHQISISLERKKAEEDLKKALEKAQEGDRLKSAFLANMSHEIRTPMNGILGFTQLLQDPNLSGEDIKLYIDIITKSGNRLLNTINDIIDISKIEAGQVKVINSDTDISQILKSQYFFFKPQAEAKNLALDYEPTLSQSESCVGIDQHKLESILINLIKNAIKYTDKGKITFGCIPKENNGDRYLEFYVKDTGIGIPHNRVHAIFNRFEQADIADTRAYQGSGLGLAIAKSYTEMLGGRIWVESVEGMGSVFSFTVPVSSPAVKEFQNNQTTEYQSETSFNNLSAIIAEDDESNQLFYQIIFKNTFQSIVFTSTGKETIEKCRANPATDVILMDIKMPDINGYDATREIRKFNKKVIIIAQTAYGLAGDREKALQAGCNDYIAKPIKMKVMLDMISRNVKNTQQQGLE